MGPSGNPGQAVLEGDRPHPEWQKRSTWPRDRGAL